MTTNPKDSQNQPVALSPAERRVIALLVAGRTNKEIAAELDVVEQTVKNTLTSVYRKVGVRNRTELVRLAITNGMVKG